MKKNILILSALALTISASAQDISTVRNTTELLIQPATNGSARYNAMAGAMGAMGGEISAIANNPAAIGVAIQGDMNITGAYHSYRNSVQLGNAKREYENNYMDLSNFSASLVYQLPQQSKWKFVNFAGNISNQKLDNYVESPGMSNFSIEKNLIDANDNLVKGNLRLDRHAYDRTGFSTLMNFAIGANYDNRLYIGGGINYHGLRIEQSDTAQMTLDLDKSTDTYYKQFTPFTEEISGINASLGIIGKINNNFRVGASITTPTVYSIDRAFDFYKTGNDGYTVADTAAESRRFTSPTRGMISAAFVPNKNLSFNADYQFSMGKPKFREEGYGAEEELNAFYQEHFKSAQEIRLGAEYRIQQFRIRGGYGTQFNPFNTISINTANGQVGSPNLILSQRSTAGIGLGYDFRNFNIDLAYQNVHSTYMNPILGGADLDGYSSGYYSKNFDIAPGYFQDTEVKNTQNRVFLTLGWKF